MLNMKFKIILLTNLLLCFFISAVAQSPFIDEIEVFKKMDSLHPPAKNAILLVGSSSFRKWTDVQSYFPLYPIINRGFGGSSIPDVVSYANDIIFPYNPRQILIYCGENDIAGSDTSISGKDVLERFKKLFFLIRSRLPEVSIAFVSMKPSVSREKLWPVMVTGNRLIKKFLSRQKKTAFINVYDAMFLPDGTVMKDIFLADNLHMNAKGYAIWKRIIEPYLIK